MTLVQSLYHKYQRYRTLMTDHITALPIVILMPHSACNCKCVMCDIWKDNKNLRQLKDDDLNGLMYSLGKLGTKQVLMSGGEALLNPLFFEFCKKLNRAGIKVSLLSTGLTLQKHAEAIVNHVNDVIISLDGDEALHDRIRNVPGAYRKMREGVRAIKAIDPGFKITARTVIHRLNFSHWIPILESARELGVDQVSFLPADVSSHAFNREVLWTEKKQHEIMLSLEDVGELQEVTETFLFYLEEHGLQSFVAESPLKLRKILEYYRALWGLNAFPFKKCNAPWVSTVVEADGTVRPCFFHAPIGNIRKNSLLEILNGVQGIAFRKSLDMNTNETCKKCVCYLNLSPKNKIFS
jgi:MoaA/NifB/PqqE/SkfB family radical SAM enzyme